MQPLRYSINVTLDGCCDHLAVDPTDAMVRHAAETLARADGLLFGRVIYEMMESAWRLPQARAMPEWMEGFAQTIDAAKKYVVSSTLTTVDWNAELVQGDLETAVRKLKTQDGRGILTGGLQLPLALAKLGLIDEYQFVVHPRLVGHGPTLFAGLAQHIDLQLVDRTELGGGVTVLQYEPRR